MMRVNLWGNFVCAKAVLPAMIEQRSGSIIGMTSIAAKRKGGRRATHPARFG